MSFQRTLNGDTWATKTSPKNKMRAVSMATEDEGEEKQAEEEAEDDQEEMECEEEEDDAETTSDKGSVTQCWGCTLSPGKPVTWEADEDDENSRLIVKTVCLTDAVGGEDVVVAVTVSDLTSHPIASLQPGKTTMATMNSVFSSPVTFEITKGNGTVHVFGNVGTEPDISSLHELARARQNATEDEETTDEDYEVQSDEDEDDDDESEEDLDDDELEDIDFDALSGSDDSTLYLLATPEKAKYENHEGEGEVELADESADEEEDEEESEEEEAEDEEEVDEEIEDEVEDGGEEEADVDEEDEEEEVEADEADDEGDEAAEEVEAEDEEDYDNAEETDEHEDVEAEEQEEEEDSAEEEMAAQDEEDDGVESDASNSRYEMAKHVPLKEAMEKIDESINLADHENSLSRKRKSFHPAEDEAKVVAELSDSDDGPRKRRKSNGSHRLRQSRTPSFELRNHSRE